MMLNLSLVGSSIQKEICYKLTSKCKLRVTIIQPKPFFLVFASFAIMSDYAIFVWAQSTKDDNLKSSEIFVAKYLS